MKKIVPVLLSVLMLTSIFAGCSGQSKAEENALAYLEILYNCPSEEFSEYFKNSEYPTDPTPNLQGAFSPYATQEHTADISKIYALGLQLNCMGGGSSRVKGITVDEVKKGQLEATVDVVCTNPEGTEKDITLFILMNTDENDKVYFSRPPENHREYQDAVTGDIGYKPEAKK